MLLKIDATPSFSHGFFSFLFDWKKRFFYWFIVAEGAPARIFNSFSLFESKTAFFAPGRNNNQFKLISILYFPDMIKMFIYFFFRNPDMNGYLSGREPLFFKNRDYLFSNCFTPFRGNKRLFRFLFQNLFKIPFFRWSFIHNILFKNSYP